ncbi:hypothetical protein MTR67_044229 [Solanum verrucosum]|uniref:Uncharacterized protein n=1 Tax=Solanum verrucosum TaxID=315347 RepID=A0AAF0URZ7_SOLVR|nr:hypothetical protein MTR67_044229 [Solanum verrucosum]
MSSGGYDDRSHEHLGVSQTNRTKKKNHDTHLFAVPIGTVDPRAYYPNYRRLVSVSSTSQALPPRRYEDLPLQAICQARTLSAGRISDDTPSPRSTYPQLYAIRVEDSSSEQSDAMAGTPPLTQHFVHPGVSPSSTVAPSATLDDETPALAPGKKDRLGRVMIEPDGSLWNLAKDAARALKKCVRRLFTHAYHSWSEIPNNICQTMFNEFKYWNTYKFKAMCEQSKKARASLKGGSLHTGGAKTVGTITREMLTSTLAESEWRRLAEQQSMSETVQQIKEQVLNLARRPTTSSPAEDTDDDSDEGDDFVYRTP